MARIVGTCHDFPMKAALAFVLGLTLAGAALAQELPDPVQIIGTESSPTGLNDASTPEDVASKREAIDRELEALEAAIDTAAPNEAEHLKSLQALLQQVDGLLERQVAVEPTSPSPPAPPIDASTEQPSVFALNILYEARFALEEQGRARAEALTQARGALAAAKERFDAAERARRNARTLHEEASGAEKANAHRSLELRELESRVAREEVALRRAELHAIQAVADTTQAVAELDLAIEGAREAFARGDADPQLDLAELAARDAELERRREAMATRLAEAERSAEGASLRFGGEATLTELERSEMRALRGLRDVLAESITLIDSRRTRNHTQRELWSRWNAVLRGDAPREARADWEASLSDTVTALRQTQADRERRAFEIQERLDELTTAHAGAPEDSALKLALSNQLDAATSLQRDLRAAVASIAEERRLAERVLADIGGGAAVSPREVFSRLGEKIRDAWSYEVMSVQDHSITVGSFVLALLLLLLGWWAARRGSGFIARASQTRFKLDPGAAHALQTLSFYVLLAGFTLFALHTIRFPLTAFTVLGGALAIGIGFGSQNVMNNFISGLILMLERPVRAHDLVEVDGNHGRIEKIGARSTQIRSVDGRHIIVPNSFFLESNVVNWTLSDDLIRTSVSVGVIYGSPTEVVKKLILQAVDEDDMVLRTPQPIVVFEAFGDNSLNFDVYFWIRARAPMEARVVQSRIRFRVDDLFRENQLVIAFPQRDVHLDTAAPIEVRVLTEKRD